MEKDNKLSNREGGRVIAGLILVGIGAAFLLRNTGFILPNWLFSWPVILILVGIYSGVKHNFRNNSWIILIVIGGFFLADRFIPEFRLAHTFWPVVIIGAGIIMMIRPRRNSWFDKENWQNRDKWKEKRGWGNHAGSSTAMHDSSDSLHINSFFSGIERTMLSKNFQGGSIKAVFGGVDIDLSQADIQGEVMIRLDVAFGGVKLIVPPHWTIKNEIDGLFHGVEDKRNFNATTLVDANKVLLLQGSVVFGGLDIKNY
jgi:predicted membrane protein